MYSIGTETQVGYCAEKCKYQCCASGLWICKTDMNSATTYKSTYSKGNANKKREITFFYYIDFGKYKIVALVVITNTSLTR